MKMKYMDSCVGSKAMVEVIVEIMVESNEEESEFASPYESKMTPSGMVDFCMISGFSLFRKNNS